MGLQPAVCTSCGGSINVDDINLNGYGECQFCGVGYKVIDVITIDGLPTLKNHIDSAAISIKMGNLEKAVKSYNEAILLKPNCHEAWWGLYLCNDSFDRYYGYQDKYGNKGMNVKASIIYNTLEKYAFRAIEYAPPEMASYYKTQISDHVNFLESLNNPSQSNSKNSGSAKSGCYIATAVYGSYDCEQVMVLREFRDNVLLKKSWGRIFVKMYYSISPKLVKYIRKDSKLEQNIRSGLDFLITKVNK